MTSPSSHRITIRLTGEEYLELKAKAGDAPLSSFVRAAALETAAAKRKAPTVNRHPIVTPDRRRILTPFRAELARRCVVFM